MTSDLKLLYLRELATFEAELALFPSDEAVWLAPPGASNAAGTLVLHVCGNLRHFVGAQLGATGYVRDRDAEFARRGVSRDELMAELRAARADVAATLDRLGVAALDGPYPLELAGVRPVTRQFLLHLLSHLAYHLGQLDYLRKLVTGEATPAGALSLAQLEPAG